LDGFREHRAAIEEAGGSIVAASVDDTEKAGEIAEGKGFPFGYGVTREIADALGSWWEDRRGIIQPSEFLVSAENKVIVSSYSDGPIGRFDAPDVIKVINFYESMKKK
jgi:peroxiredoxin